MAVPPRRLQLVRPCQLLAGATARNDDTPTSESAGASSTALPLVSERAIPVGMPVDLDLAQGHAYVVSITREGRTGGLSVFDVTNPRNPILKTTLSRPEDDGGTSVRAKGPALYIAHERGTRVYDISRPTDPVLLRTLPTGELGTWMVLVEGDRLYSLVPGAGLQVHDLTDPLNPTPLAVIDTPEDAARGGPEDFVVDQGRIYLSDALAGYCVLDITNQEDVRLLGQYRPSSLGDGHHSAVGHFEGKRIAFEAGERPAPHIRVLDVTDPANIAKLGEFRLQQSSSIQNLLLRGDRLHVAWNQEGLRVLDVSNPSLPREVAHGHVDARPQNTVGLHIPGDGHVYVVDATRGLLIFEDLQP
ncbi:LVIVD repeat-containing protein [Myxococcus landrumensis]|uniref:Lipoprotein n=1 Tax=Myxococcus landrumensis TaxID=2813577 RepID=A0ABX7N2Z1_9BACT|nr:hypothetical protein [Myxococcus landrumus]QSQ13109.1 hypothetical protein JY572_32920 [Myxococcus landrumus]